MRVPLVLAAVLTVLLAPALAAAHDRGASSPDLPNALWHPAIANALLRQGAAQAVAPAPIVQGASGGLEQVGHEPLRNRGMNSALAVHNGYAYVGFRSDGTKRNAGVRIVDVRDPAKPTDIGEIGLPNEGNVGESSRELRILPDKGLLLVLNHACSELIHRCAAPSQTGFSAMRSTIRFFDISGENAAKPKLVSTYQPSRSAPQQPHEFFVWTDPERPSRVLLYQSTPTGETAARPRENLIVTDISRAREGLFPEIERWSPGFVPPADDKGADVRLHSLTVSYDGRRAYLAYLGGGFLVADTSDFAENEPAPRVRPITPFERRAHWGNPGAHSAVKVPGRDFAFTTDEVYGKFGGVLAEHGCPWGFARTVAIGDETAPKVASEYRLPVNRPEFCATGNTPVRENFSSFASHNPTLTRNLALVTWHSAGLQMVDLEDPARPRPAAEFLPEPLAAVDTEDPALSQGQDKVVMWSFPVVVDGLIYVVDLRNGLYVLRYKGPHAGEVSSTAFLDGNSNSGDVRRFEYGDEATKGAAASTTPEGRPVPPAIPARACLPAPMRAGSRGIGPVGLGAFRERVLRRTGPAERLGPRSARYCVEGGGGLVAAFTRSERTVLVATSSPRLTPSRVVPGQTLRQARRRARLRRVGRDVYRLGTRRFVTVRRGRVAIVGVASNGLLERPAVLKRSLRGL
jgi:hypothetical protein